VDREQDRRRLRVTFEEVPELYDRVRPRYPAAIFDDLLALAGLRPGSRVVEIGCGTGQATEPLAERGLVLLAVELGPRLAELARRKLTRFPLVEVVNDDFETWEPPEAPFDAVVAFTSFHWLDPSLRYAKPAWLLRDGGSLAVVDTAAVLPESGDPFWVEVQEDYDAVVPSPDNRPAPAPAEVGDLTDALEASSLFGDVVVRRYLWEVEYTAQAWIDVMNTYSPNRALDPSTRRRLFERIHRRIESRPDGRVRKHYLATLNAARRR
jgi:SAM-dependent methyltransferase